MKTDNQSAKHLVAWLKDRKTPKGDFAKTLGISKPTMSRILQARQVPDIGLAMKIEFETRGFVSVKGWVIPLTLEAAE